MSLVSAGQEGADQQNDAAGIKASNIKDADLALMHEHDPQLEKASFELLDGFEVNLFAAEPMLAKPVQMTWDAQGRLWVACSTAYPQLQPGEQPNDKIVVLEDSNGDGRADKSVVFVDGLYLPTGLELANGGVYVAQTPDVLFLKDTDGDSVADYREVAITGFGIEDSHHSISAWRRGPGGWIYFQEGVFLNTQVETQHGLVRNFNGGVYQYNPVSGQLRIFANVGVGNPWGHVFDPWGQSFLIDNPRVSYLTPSTGNSGTKIQPLVLLKTEKQCGGDLISGTHFPPELQGQLLTCRFKSRAVIRHEFADDGSGFSARILPPLIRSRHPNFRPVDCKIGPDGAVYVADWYNPIINHAQHDFRDPRRDKNHGRIWRITAKDRPLAEAPRLAELSLRALVEQLKSPNVWTRHYARLAISERPVDQTARLLSEWVAGLDRSDARYDRHLIEALWAFQNTQQVSQPLLHAALNAKTGEARAAAVRLVRYWHEELSDPIGIVERAAADPFARVRLEAVLAAGFIPDGRALTAALRALDYPRDRFIDSALDQTVLALSRHIDDSLEFAHSTHREYALQRAGLGVDHRLAALLRKGTGSQEQIRLIRRQLVRDPSAKTVRMVARALANDSDSLSPQLTTAMMAALSQIGRRKQFNMAGRMEPLVDFLASDDAQLTIAALDTLAAWNVASAGPSILGVLHDADRDLDVRRAAASTIGQMKRSDLVEQLYAMASPDQTLQNRYLAVHGLVLANINDAADAAGELLALDCQQNDPVPLVLQFLQRRGGESRLARALSKTEPHATVSAAVTEHFNQTGLLTEALARHFRPVGTFSLSEQLLTEDIAQLAAEVDQIGDPVRGERIYRRTSLACSSCHGIGRVGATIGPDLAAVGSAATTPYIVDSLLRPNKAIAEHYETYSVLTVDGRIRKGILGFQNEQEIILHDPEQVEPVQIARDEIELMQPAASLMPTGLVDRLTSRQEFLDLVHFVSRLGRPGRYATSVAPVIRRWRVLQDSRSADSLKLSDIAAQSEWSPAYSLVRGVLPSADFGGDTSAFVRAFVNVQEGGTVRLKMNTPAGLRLWLDKRELHDLLSPLELREGRRTLTFLIDSARRGEKGLRVELIDSEDRPARYQIEGGR